MPPHLNVVTDPKAFAQSSYDFIVVGGGTAGLAVAARLSENPSITVAVLEAGPDLSADPNVALAAGWLITTSDPKYTWGFESEVQKHVADRRITLPRGKLLGGTSAINALMWTRAGRPEYDAWEALGNPGWNFEALLPYFNRSQSHKPQKNDLYGGKDEITEYNGTHGPVKTSYNTWYSSVIPAFKESVLDLSFEVNHNPFSGDATGFYNLAPSVDHDKAERQHAAVTYLAQASERPNISVLLGAHATRIIFADATGDLVAEGVEFDCSGTRYTVKGNKEVILSAGTYQTPQLLELSGIGKASVLGQFGIKTRVELPVGENLQDHILVPLQFGFTPEATAGLAVLPINADVKDEPGKDAKSTTTGGPFLLATMDKIISDAQHAELVSTLDGYLASTGLSPLEREQLKFQRQWLCREGAPVADAQVMYASLPGMAAIPTPDGQMVIWFPITHLHPASRGSVHIKSADPLAAPSIDPNFLSREYDLKTLIHVVRFTQKLAKTGALSKLVSGPVLPPQNVETDEELSEWIRANMTTVFHPVGTAPMAARELGGAVDPSLKVYGTRNVRVVDASVIPLQLGATPMATIYAIAEKVSSESLLRYTRSR
ncbi:hypothetical protein HGRIS_014472 [Hohenbuehelia grisea]|uniref:Glucose-methanol-choline oxidoreductase N-terminal domain-containing protein n=1 Tax=Hohenbuehelia grisea TaxID=104357 RepID=A0ABR3JVT1_9AGAR